ncbi:MAG: hypothetical protein FJY95_09215 [Candidatus Handelsmanbacteria bacterium]|nr:hypothetical protein [Candidatus Handelsmanbacteria bacterium]
MVKVHTDEGLVGYGDNEDNPHPIPQHIIDSLVGRDPFDHLHNNLHLALGMALCDVMGKHLGLPAYNLIGQKVREAAPVAAWTRPCPPWPGLRRGNTSRRPASWGCCACPADTPPTAGAIPTWRA